LVSPEQAQALDDHAALELIFLPGFSTSATVTETSGRGVGMDVVRQQVEHLSGHVRIHSTPGQGTRFTITGHDPCRTGRAG
jgi:two-component system chemotaxis sensor kinase CheA